MYQFIFLVKVEWISLNVVEFAYLWSNLCQFVIDFHLWIDFIFWLDACCSSLNLALDLRYKRQVNIYQLNLALYLRIISKASEHLSIEFGIVFDDSWKVCIDFITFDFDSHWDIKIVVIEIGDWIWCLKIVLEKKTLW